VQIDVVSSETHILEASGDEPNSKQTVIPTPKDQYLKMVYLKKDEKVSVGDVVQGVTRDRRSISHGWTSSSHLNSYKIVRQTANSPGMRVQDDLLARKISNLPDISLSSSSVDVLRQEAEIRREMKAKGLAEDATVQSIVSFNQPSSVTHKAQYFTYVISIRHKVVLQLQGDDLWLIENGKKKFSDSEREILARVLGTN
jgi:hypothetical protein